MPHELDVVRFREKVGAWPAGTRGTLVSAFAENGMIEVVGDDGDTLDLVVMPYAKMEVVWSVESERVH